MLRQVQKLCYCDKERTGRHIFHGSFTNVLSGYMTDISLLSPIPVGDGVPEEETNHYGHRRANIVTDEQILSQTGNFVTDVETMSETKWITSNLSSSTTSSAVSRARWSADMLEAWDHKYKFARKIFPLLSYLDDAAAVDNKEGVVGEVCCGVQHPETPRHLGFKDFLVTTWYLSKFPPPRQSCLTAWS